MKPSAKSITPVRASVFDEGIGTAYVTAVVTIALVSFSGKDLNLLVALRALLEEETSLAPETASGWANPQ
jgi:hypothetical protein